MSTQSEEKKQTPPTQEKKSDREKSAIAFPYVPYDDALTIAKAVHDYGGVPVTRDQLSSIVQETKNFDLKVAAARLFGLVDAPSGKYQLTELAYLALDKDENRQKEAKRDAFLNIPLYRKVYEDCKGKPLPPRPTGLEHLFLNLGVATKQVGPARIAFDKSASQTGYFPNGNQDRLVAPIIASSSRIPSENNGAIEKPAPKVQQELPKGEAAGTIFERDQVKKQFHPFIDGLLDELPQTRTIWSHAERAKWLRAAAQIFDLIYKPDDQNMPKRAIQVVCDSEET